MIFGSVLGLSGHEWSLKREFCRPRGQPDYGSVYEPTSGLVYELTNPCVADEKASQTKPIDKPVLHENCWKNDGFSAKSVVSKREATVYI